MALLDVIVVTVATGGAYASLVDRASSPVEQIVAGLGVAALFFAVAFVVDRARVRLARQRRPPGGVTLTILGAIGVTTQEASDPAARVKAGLIGFGIDGCLGGGTGVAAWWLYGDGGAMRVWLTVLCAAVASCCLARLLPVLGVDGGRILSGVAELADDDESGSRAAQICSFLVSIVLVLGGVGLILKANEFTFWGIGMTMAAVQALSLSTWYERRAEWLASASVTPLNLLHPPAFATVAGHAPLSELMTIFAVEGPRALVVVVDHLGCPIGVVKGQQFGPIWREATQSSEVREAMTPVGDILRIPVDETIAEALAQLERECRTIAAFEGERGRPRVVTFQELNRDGR